MIGLFRRISRHRSTGLACPGNVIASPTRVGLNNGIERLIKKIVAEMPSRELLVFPDTHFTECN
ncbi:hypothetical protein J6590_007934 [Homalodisca vitripennis]|nr:hypothetical protein J6590_007934 [Homalodisca vitripennis]